MSEAEFKSILEQVCTANYYVPADVPEHRFSHRHNRRMKRIFKLYEKNVRKMCADNRPKIQRPKRLTLKHAVVLVALIFLAALAGCTAAHFISQSFRGDVHKEFTRIFPINTENCPNTIEEKYYLPELPEGFAVLETDSTPFQEYISYENKLTRHTIAFRQMVKTYLQTTHLNTENHEIEEVDINGHIGLCIDFSDSERTHSMLMWDNGDYILEISADFTKSELLDLAKTAKVLNN